MTGSSNNLRASTTSNGALSGGNLRASTTSNGALSGGNLSRGNLSSGGNLSGSPSKRKQTRRRSLQQQQPDDFSHIHVMDASQGDHLSEIDNLSYRFELEQQLGASGDNNLGRERRGDDTDDNENKSYHSTPPTKETGHDDDDDNESSVDSTHAGVDVKNMAQYETQNVTRWKTFVMFLFLVNAALVIVSTFEFMRRSEEEDFENGVRILLYCTLCRRLLFSAVFVVWAYET